jgi:ubiquinone/menaquinone biosynthesis C-methylase UbiE
MNLLDVGCGPGTITADFARLLTNGTVTGIDSSKEVIDAAAGDPDHSSITNLVFTTGDTYALDYEDATFDVVHAHQVLQHLARPIDALAEMRRVLRPGGLIAARECDYGGFIWSPADPNLDRWLELHHRVTAENGAECDAARHLLEWFSAAGFSDVTVSGSLWTFADPETRTWWGDSWAERVERSAFATQVVDYGFSEREELTLIATSWRQWAQEPNGFFAVPHGEVLARR